MELFGKSQLLKALLAILLYVYSNFVGILNTWARGDSPCQVLWNGGKSQPPRPMQKQNRSTLPWSTGMGRSFDQPPKSLPTPCRQMRCPGHWEQRPGSWGPGNGPRQLLGEHIFFSHTCMTWKPPFEVCLKVQEHFFMPLTLEVWMGAAQQCSAGPGWSPLSS